MKQSWLTTHAETIAQNVIGQILYFAILWVFGLPLATIGSLQVVCFFVGYGRSYAIRRFFDWWQHRKQTAEWKSIFEGPTVDRALTPEEINVLLDRQESSKS